VHPQPTLHGGSYNYSFSAAATDTEVFRDHYQQQVDGLPTNDIATFFGATHSTHSPGPFGVLLCAGWSAVRFLRERCVAFPETVASERGGKTVLSIDGSLSLTSVLSFVESASPLPVDYAVGGTELTIENREYAAQLLADDAMRIRCGDSPVLETWRSCRDGGAPATGSRKAALEAYVGIGFRLPGQTVNNDHVQGHVAELIWNRVMQERAVCRDGRRLVRAVPIKADPLEPGGDGLVIYSSSCGKDGDELVFRLWEIKKHDASARVSATIGRASSQLRTRGHEYLAKLSGPETVAEEGPIGDLYANAVELWFDRSSRSGVGVSVGTSADRVPSGPNSFRSIQTAFPEHSEPGQLEGLVVAIPNFPAFAERVKEILWSGL
jgi:hypothetical protein